MNRRLTTILFIAFVVAALSSYLVYRVAGAQMRGAKGPKTTHILVAARDLEIGTLIKDSDLSTSEWVGTLPKGAVLSKDNAIGRGVVSPVYQGETILDSRLAPVGSGGGLAATIRPGMRAVAVRVNDVVGVAGFVVPGMRVDVLVSGNGPGVSTTEGPKVKTILQSIEVLSAGTNIQKDNEGKPVQVQVVNLLVTPEQAEVLSLASNEMRIQLVLRNPLDTETAKTPGTAMARLFSDGAPAPKPVAVAPRRAPAPAPQVVEKPAPRIYLIEVLNGSKRSEEKFGAAEHQ
ncbi:MAG TPA: Flp pilus assembly protein CpaB [Bryobacteraceae bacterium]|jgi:pilus assembly protein CpaB